MVLDKALYNCVCLWFTGVLNILQYFNSIHFRDIDMLMSGLFFPSPFCPSQPIFLTAFMIKIALSQSSCLWNVKSVKVSNDSSHNWLSFLELPHVWSEVLSGSSSAVRTINTAVSYPYRRDPSIAGALGQLSHILWTPWVLKLIQRERLLTDFSVYLCGSEGICVCAPQQFDCGNMHPSDLWLQANCVFMACITSDMSNI